MAGTGNQVQSDNNNRAGNRLACCGNGSTGLDWTGLDWTGNQVQSDNNNRNGNEVQIDHTKPSGKIVRFDGDANNNGKPIMHGTGLGIETRTKNKAKFSKRDVKRAEKARRLQHIAAHLSHKQLLSITQKNQLKNCPIVPRDIRLIDEILGPIVPGLKGKTMRRNNE